MLKAEEQMELVVLKKHGASIRELARTTGRSRNTVRRYLRDGEAAATRKRAATCTARRIWEVFRPARSNVCR